MPTLDEIIDKLEAQSNINRDELKEKIKKRHDGLEGFVSMEGAAYLVAKELGVNMLSSEKRKLDIKNIVTGMRNVSVAGRLFRISNTVDFKKSNGNSGRVANIFIGDRTGFVRMPLWNDQVKMLDEGSINIGDVVQVSGAISQENIYGEVELSLGKYGKVFNVSDEAMSAEIEKEYPPAEDLQKYFLGTGSSDRVPIKSISAGNFEVRGTIIDVIRSNFVFYRCPTCGGKAVRGYDVSGQVKFECQEHGKVDAEPAMVVSFIVDDGTGMLRVVAFRETAQKFTTTSAGELDKLTPDERYGILSGSMLGKEYIIHGSVKKDRSFDRLEMVADMIKPTDLKEESEKLTDLLRMKLG
jgi:ssDNA-binding replication factor A large subunit